MNQEQINQTIEVVCKELGVKKFDVLSPKRHNFIVSCRFMLIGIFRDAFRLTYCEIAEIMHRDDHTTIWNGYKKLKLYCETDEVFRQKYEQVHFALFGNVNYIHANFRSKEANMSERVYRPSEYSNAQNNQAVYK